MATARDYEAYKAFLKSLNLTPEQYEKKLKAWCRRNGY